MSQENLSEIIRWKIKRTMMEFVSILFLFAGFFATLIAALNLAFTQENFLFCLSLATSMMITDVGDRLYW